MVIKKLETKIAGEVYMMVNHNDDRELADEVVANIMKIIKDLDNK